MRSAPPTSCAGSRWSSSARCSTCSRARPARCSTTGSRATWSKALYGFDAIVGNYASPTPPGSAYVMLHHAFGEVNGKKGVWGHAIGGMGAITQAMAARPRAHGAEIEIDRRRARGDRRARPRRRRHPRQRRDHPRQICRLQRQSETACIRGWCRRMRLPAAFLDRIRNWRNGSGTFRMNVALIAHCPRSPRCRASGDHLTAGIIIGPSLGYMDRAWQDARTHGWSREPVDRAADPLDARRHAGARRGSMSPACSASMSRRNCPDGRSWDDHRDEVADLDDRDGGSLRAGLCGKRDRPADVCRRSIWSASSACSAAISFTAR